MGDGKPIAVDFEIRGFAAGQRDQRYGGSGTRFIDGDLLGREEKDFESGGDEGTLCYCGVRIGH